MAPGTHEEDAFLSSAPGGAAARGRSAGPKKSGGSGGSSLPWYMPSFLHFVLPWLMFTLVTMLFTYGYHQIPALVWVTTIMCSIFAMIFIFTSNTDPEGRSAIILGILCIFAVGLAILAGNANYSWNMAPYWAYEEAREYHNVLPSEPAAAHADAGKITFAEAARIDTTKAVGYKAAQTYCVAPILDPSSTTRVEFWAVGIDCCSERGEFQCDDANLEGPNAAKGGVVVMDNRFLSGASHFEYFGKAVKEAEAANDLVSASEPIFVRWVKDPEAIQNSLFARGTSSLLAYSVLHLLINASFAFAAKMLHDKSERTAAERRKGGGQYP